MGQLFDVSLFLFMYCLSVWFCCYSIPNTLFSEEIQFCCVVQAGFELLGTIRTRPFEQLELLSHAISALNFLVFCTSLIFYSEPLLTTIPILKNSISFYFILFSLYVLLADILEQYKLYSMEFSTQIIQSPEHNLKQNSYYLLNVCMNFYSNYAHVS